MSDISIDQEKAMIWITNVNQELIEVEQVLKNVTRETMTLPQEDDDIMKGIEKTCRELETFWNNMCDGFRSASNTLKDVIQKIGIKGQEVIEEIDKVKSRIGR